MSFPIGQLEPSVAEILALAENGERLMPLAGGRCCSPEAAARLRKLEGRTAFPGAREPEAALAGLWLYFSCLEESHEISQRLQSREGAFWHGILHRQEPDAWNAKYWFRQVGAHPVFPAIGQEAAAIAQQSAPDLALPNPWDPAWFVDLCDRLRTQPQHPHYHAALAIQRAEWQRLFLYCASHP